MGSDVVSRRFGDTFCAFRDSRFGPFHIAGLHLFHAEPFFLTEGLMATMEGGKHLTGIVSDPSNSNEPNASPTPAPARSAVAAPTWKGRMIKRFRLLDELGEGAMGRVFVAEDTVLKRHVAMKLLPAKHRDGRPNHRTQRLITEARAAA